MRRLAFVIALGAAGCSARVAPGADASSAGDARPATDRVIVSADSLSPTADSDGDGVCDATEAMRRTDPTLADTDYDGLSDGFELRYGSDPLNANNPSMRDRLQLDEREGSEWPLPWFVQWQGMGEGLLLTLLDRAPGLDGRRFTEVSDFSLEAVGGNPAAFVNGAEGARFFGVGGPVRLEWRITARWRDVAAVDGGLPARLGCRRAYEGLAIIKQDGGETVGARRLILDVVPAQGAMDGGTVAWPAGVTDEGLCRYDACL
ncbi:MAG: hypothetical protein R3A48_19220 [Polyangiales bacterium]